MLSSLRPFRRHAPRPDRGHSSPTGRFEFSRHSSLAARHFLAAEVLKNINSFRIRTSATRARNPFRFRTSATHSDLHIPKDLQESLPSRNSFIFCTYQPSRMCGKQTTYNPFKIRTYRNFARNSFRIRTSKNPGGGRLRSPLNQTRRSNCPALLPRPLHSQSSSLQPVARTFRHQRVQGPAISRPHRPRPSLRSLSSPFAVHYSLLTPRASRPK